MKHNRSIIGMLSAILASVGFSGTNVREIKADPVKAEKALHAISPERYFRGHSRAGSRKKHPNRLHVSRRVKAKHRKAV